MGFGVSIDIEEMKKAILSLRKRLVECIEQKGDQPEHMLQKEILVHVWRARKNAENERELK